MPIYKEIYNGPPRGYTGSYSKKRYIAIHNTSNDAPAKNEASYAKNRTDSVSSHYYIDDDVAIQSLNTDYRAWHAGSSTGNSYAIAYEIVGTNSKSRSWWISNVNWDALAKCIARDMKHFGIANKHLTLSQMKDGKSTGIVTHDDMRRAWGGTTHNDPGPNFPMDYLIDRVNSALKGDDDMALSNDDLKKIGLTVATWDFKNGEGVEEAYRVALRAADNAQQANTKITDLSEQVNKLVATPPGSVVITDEQLERVLRKVIGSVDGVNVK